MNREADPERRLEGEERPPAGRAPGKDEEEGIAPPDVPDRPLPRVRGLGPPGARGSAREPPRSPPSAPGGSTPPWVG